MCIDPQDIDPDTGRPYRGYSSPALDTSFHDGEMDIDDCGDDEEPEELIECPACGAQYDPSWDDCPFCADDRLVYDEPEG